MKVLVTGGCGFLGSHVCEFYLKKGDTVISYDNMTKHELERTGFATEAARNYNWDYLKNLGV
ncbi:MAG: GDP-mannose 4,6-dehydratase, partial [Deltaproteobacteria bacterium]